jgi:peroxiredoxin
LRDAYGKITATGADVVLIGTGNLAYARDVQTKLDLPYLVLVDDDAAAANAASVRRVGVFGLFSPRSWPGTRRAWRAGHRIGKGGTRVNQLGATFVIDRHGLRYEHFDAHTADHAPLAAVLAALPTP